jgi:hypothetical protein
MIFYLVNRKMFPGDQPIQVEGEPIDQDYIQLAGRKHITKVVGHMYTYFNSVTSANDWLSNNLPKCRILKVTDKYATNYYNISNAEQRDLVCLSLLTARKESYGVSPPKHVELMSNEKYAKTPKFLQEVYNRALEEYELALNTYQHGMRFIKEVEHAIANKNGTLALDLLLERSDYEYEHIEVITPFEVTDGNNLYF